MLDGLIIILLLTPLGLPMVPLGLPMVPLVPTFRPMVPLAPMVLPLAPIVPLGGRTGLVVRASDSGSGDPGSILSLVGVFVSLSKRQFTPQKYW